MLNLIRVNSDLFGTIGVLKFGRKVICWSFELPWRSNDVGVSCIPEGAYSCWKAKSEKFGDVVYVSGVTGRTGILIHSGNTLDDTRGCILVGLDTDGKSVSHSRIALKRLLDELPEKFELNVRKVG